MTMPAASMAAAAIAAVIAVIDRKKIPGQVTVREFLRRNCM